MRIMDVIYLTKKLDGFTILEKDGLKLITRKDIIDGDNTTWDERLLLFRDFNIHDIITLMRMLEKFGDVSVVFTTIPRWFAESKVESVFIDWFNMAIHYDEFAKKRATIYSIYEYMYMIFETKWWKKLKSYDEYHAGNLTIIHDKERRTLLFIFEVIRNETRDGVVLLLNPFDDVKIFPT